MDSADARSTAAMSLWTTQFPPLLLNTRRIASAMRGKMLSRYPLLCMSVSLEKLFVRADVGYMVLLIRSKVLATVLSISMPADVSRPGQEVPRTRRANFSSHE